MRYSARQYAKAFVAALELVPKSKEETASRALIAIAKENGDGRELDKITWEIERLLARKKGGRSVLVESARTIAPRGHKKLFSRFGKNDIVREKISPELVAGLRITLDGELELDRSLTGMLRRVLA